jgi:hypothetical protein
MLFVQSMTEVEMFRKLANDCIDRAQSTQDLDAAAGLLRLAEFWLAKSETMDQAPPSGTADFAAHAKHPRRM